MYNIVKRTIYNIIIEIILYFFSKLFWFIQNVYKDR